MNLPEEAYFFAALLSLCLGLLAFERIVERINARIRRQPKGTT